jgi:hypothetical protein
MNVSMNPFQSGCEREFYGAFAEMMKARAAVIHDNGRRWSCPPTFFMWRKPNIKRNP